MSRSSGQRWAIVSVFAVLCLLVSTLGVQAQEEIVAAGNGGTADASANGGAVAVGDLNAGGNAGNASGVGDTLGGVAVDGGAVTNTTSLDIAADGGTAIADASVGDDNVAFTQDPPPQVCFIDDPDQGFVCSTKFKCFYDADLGPGLNCELPFYTSNYLGFQCAPVSDSVIFCTTDAA